ncbi:hypothetical protein ACP8HZ_07305 [Francisella noatunensis]
MLRGLHYQLAPYGQTKHCQSDSR